MFSSFYGFCKFASLCLQKRLKVLSCLYCLLKNYKKELVLDVLSPNFSFRPYSIDSTVANEVKRPTHILLKNALPECHKCPNRKWKLRLRVAALRDQRIHGWCNSKPRGKWQNISTFPPYKLNMGSEGSTTINSKHHRRKTNHRLKQSASNVH